jgi:hypothetical protein
LSCGDIGGGCPEDLLADGSLIARFDTNGWQFVGSGPTTLRGPGRLQLIYNDNSYADNAGFMTVTIDVIPPGPIVSNVDSVSTPAVVSPGGAAVTFSELAARSPLGATTAQTIISAPLRSSPLRSSPLRSSPLRSSPLRSSPLRSSALGPIRLTDVPLRSSSWTDLLAGTPLNGPTNALTLNDVYSLNPVPPAVDALTLADVDLEHSPLRSSSLGAVLLGQVTLDKLAPPAGGFCVLLGRPGGCDLTHDTLLSAERAGADLSAYYAGSVPLNGPGIDISGSTLASIRLDDIDLSATALAGRTDLAPYRTVGDLVAALPLPGLNVLHLGDLAAGLVSPDALPFELAPLTALLANAPVRTTDLLSYNVDATIGCDRTQTLTFEEHLPAGARYVAGSASVSVSAPITSFAAIRPLAALRPLAATAGTTGIPVDDPPDISAPTLTFDASSTIAAACAGDPLRTDVILHIQAEPPPHLGPAPLASTVLVDGESAAATSTGSTVGDVSDPGDTPATAAPLPSDTLLTGYLSSSTDVDAYTIHAPAPGSRVTVVLSHLPADYDLTITGPPVGVTAAPLRSSPLRSSPLRSSPLADNLDERSPLSTPETLQDIPLRSSDLAATPLRSSSINRSTAPESASFTVAGSDSGQDFTVRVSGFNGAHSADPYALRMEVTPPPTVPPCRPSRQLPATPRGTFPALPLAPSTKTLFLVNQQRLAQLYPSADIPALRRQLDALAGRPEVAGAVIPIESDPTVATAPDYAAWDQDPCSVAAANAVSSDVLAVLKHVGAHLNQLRNVVVVGGDEVIPQVRVPDLTAVANEREEAGELDFGGHENAVSSALRQGFMLTDDAYGDAAPQAWLGGSTFVPDIALGRLVETPAQIADQLTQYTSSNGVLSVASAHVAGYDFLTDGATAILNGLRPLVPSAQVTSRIDETWTAADAISAFDRATPGITSVNAHYDQYRALPAATFHNSVPDLISDSSVTSAAGSLLFTAGCHAGLNIEDVGVPNATASDAPRLLDWPARMAANRAVYVANTTFGYGDTETVAYTERILALLAQNLGSGQVTAGQALMLAKQRYAAEQLDPGVYDAKASQGMTYYGLPFYRMGPSGQEGPSVIPPEPGPSGSTLRTSPFLAAPVNVRHVTSRGSYWTADGQVPQTSHFRPLQPRTVLDVTPTDGLAVHGALVDDLHMSELPGIDPVYDRPTIDLGAAEPEISAISSVFPVSIQRTTRTATAAGLRDLLVLVSGQFETTAPSGTGTQRLFDRIGGTVYRSDSSDYDPPILTDISGEIVDGVATFRATTQTSGIARGVVLFRDEGAPLVWKMANMRDTGGGVWQGSALVTPGAQVVDAYTIQLVDTAGNVGISTNKGPGYVARDQPLAPGAPHLVLSPVRPASGFHRSPVTVTIDPGASTGAMFTVTVDDGAAQLYTGAFVVSGDGAHTVRFSGSDGTSGTTVINIDSTPPTVTPVISTIPSPEGFFSGPVTVGWSCADAFSGVASCPGPVTISTEGANQSRVSAPAVDQAGNTATGHVEGISIDLTPPAITINRPLLNILLLGTPLTGNATDAIAGLRSVVVKYTRLSNGQVVTNTAAVTCTASDRRSCTWRAASPPLGFWRADATATDRAGHTAIQSITSLSITL